MGGNRKPALSTSPCLNGVSTVVDLIDYTLSVHVASPGLDLLFAFFMAQVLETSLRDFGPYRQDGTLDVLC